MLLPVPAAGDHDAVAGVVGDDVSVEDVVPPIVLLSPATETPMPFAAVAWAGSTPM